MLHYILQVVAFQLAFLLIYDLFLRKETFFNYNRAYLIITAFLSVVIPFIKIERIRTAIPEAFVIHLPQVIIGEVTPASTVSPQIAELSGITIQEASMSIWSIILFIGMCIAGLILVYKIIKLVNLIQSNPKRWNAQILIIQLLNSNAAFSFFHFVFLGERISKEDHDSILQHEMVHVEQKHTLDLMFFELLRIAFWFNPLVYMYQNRISELHEYVADAKAVKHRSKNEYYDDLLSQVFETKQFSFVNPFFKKSLIKKRIMMLSKAKSKQVHMFKYVLLLPLVCTMLVYTSSYSQDPKSKKPTEVVETASSDKALRQKAYDQLVQMKANGASFDDISSFVMSANEKYILNREEYYRIAAFFDFIATSAADRKTDKGVLTDQDLNNKQRLNSIYNRTYEDYVAWKQTEDAKDTWENASRNGTLRLLIEDFNNWTENEEQEMNHKLDMIERDDYFKKLLVIDMKGKTKMILQNPTIDEFKEEVKEVVEIKEIDKDVEVPFAIVDQVPIMLACQDLKTNDAQKECMSKNIAVHVNKNFNTNMAKALGLVGKQRINVIFKISKKGNIVDVRARAPHPDLEKEAIRVIKLLPQFKPGLHKGKPVIVPYSLPILFQVKADVKNPESTTDEAIQEIVEKVETKVTKLNEVPYAVVDQAPIFPTCKDLKTDKELKTCTSNNVAMFVNKNFNLKLAEQLGLQGRQQISVMFEIDKDGSVTNVKSRAPHPNLEAEAIRVIKLLPNFIPGTHKEKPAVVSYSLPIMFQVNTSKKE